MGNLAFFTPISGVMGPYLELFFEPTLVVIALASWPEARGHRTYTTNRFAMIGEGELACQDLRNVNIMSVFAKTIAIAI